VHGVDENEPWYGHEDVDETTFRPYRKRLPAKPRDGMLLVAATFRLADGSALDGFVTPVSPEMPESGLGQLGHVQPHVFSRLGDLIGFWYGIRDPRPLIQLQYERLQRDRAAIFPIAYPSKAGLCTKAVSGEIPGFCWRTPTKLRTPEVVR
jgi:hypothetical protein